MDISKSRPTARMLTRRFSVALVALSLSACTVSPERLGDDERQTRLKSDIAAIQGFKDLPSKPVTLEYAIARAIKYGLDKRMKDMELAFAETTFDAAKVDMLPRLMVSAGYIDRSNDSGGTSQSLLTGRTSLEASTSQERSRQVSSVVFSWNILDFGVSYVRAKQSANQYLISEERRRKTIQNIIHDVRATYWRVAAAQKNLADIDAVLARVNRALANSNTAQQRGLMAPQTALAYQRSLIDIAQLLVARRQELVTARAELASLMALKPDTPYSVVVPSNLQPPKFQLVNIEALEKEALLRRTEIREEDLRRRINSLEVQRAVLQVLPGIDLSAGRYYDSNNFLFNNSWNEASTTIFSNLVRLFNAGKYKKNAEMDGELSDARRQALTLALMLQSRVVAIRYGEARKEFEFFEKSQAVDARVRDVVRSEVQKKARSEMDLVRVEARSLLSTMQYYTAYGQLQAAFSRVLHTAGVEDIPDNVEKMGLEEISGVVKSSFDRHSGRFFTSAK